ncbi:MAG: hypothetical protein ACOZQL_41785, partial [Myxococcota bacterium]
MRSLHHLVLLAVLLGGCKEVPTSALLEVSAAPGLSVDELRLSVYEESGVTVSGQRLPASGAARLPDSVVLYARQPGGSLRVQVLGFHKSALAGEGATRIPLVAGAQVRAAIQLIAGRLPDADGDGVPDAIDSCPTLANPSQQRCASDARVDALPDAGRDAPVDAARESTALDGGRDGSSRDLRRDQATPDAKKPDAAKPDAKKPDAAKPDAKKPDAAKPDAKKPDLGKPDLGGCTPGSKVLAGGIVSSEPFPVPPGCTSLTVKLWGAGGGGGGASNLPTNGGAGGGGGFVLATLSVTPGETLTVIVGGGGGGGAQGTFPGGSGGTIGGGAGGNCDQAGTNGGSGGGGGGASQVRRGTLVLASAAGGGGGG